MCKQFVNKYIEEIYLLIMTIVCKILNYHGKDVLQYKAWKFTLNSD